jgi:GNAT superfamily N-acetyltransferase
VIRPATVDDAQALAALHVRAWHRAYGDFIDAADMPTVEDREEVWRRPFPGRAWVWDQGGAVVGVVGIGDDGELSVLYVDPPAQGAGVGSALHDHALAELRAAGHARATLWIYAANGHGRDFYAARGWAPDGATGQKRGALIIRLAREL